MKNILFLCTGNSCRSQMAEGWGKALKNEKYKFYSAGTIKHGLNSNAVEVMQEVGIDISGYKSKTTNELPDIKMDFIFTVCSDAHESCPLFYEGKIIHVGFDDPPRLTNKISDKKQILDVYRRVRNQIKEFILDIEKYTENI